MLQLRALNIREVISFLREAGYKHDFTLLDKKWLCIQPATIIQCRYHVVKMYYFSHCSEVMHDEMIYGINVPEYNARGILTVSGTGNIIDFMHTVSKQADIKYNTEIQHYKTNDQITTNLNN